MCGIVGYVGYREAAPVCTAGLRRLEYRGYDSYGVAVVSDAGLSVFKQVGKISESASAAHHLTGRVGIGHTRWATHGVPSERNSHPHLDCTGKIAVVHNGIIENYAELRRGLEERGHVFSSDTDTEVIPHLIEEQEGDLFSAVSAVLPLLEGSYAILVVKEGCDEVVAARKGSPLVLGVGDAEFVLASDSLPILEYTRSVVYFEDGDCARITREGYVIRHDGQEVERSLSHLEWSVDEVRKGGFSHYMLKEIFEQPDVFANTLRAVKDSSEAMAMIRAAESVTVVACGTSANASMVFSYLMERVCRVPTRVILGSEFKYFPPPLDGLVIGVSQSGETADTIAALKLAKETGSPVLAVTNVLGSSITRVASAVVYTRAGPEMSVAATKSFTAQVAAFMQVVNLLSEHGCESELCEIQRYLADVLTLDLTEAVKLCTPASTLLYVGRGVFYPAALEGALKMKEISYIHAEGYAAGELKHGPFALLSPETPVVAICVPGPVYAVMISNLREITARGAPVIAVGVAGDRDLEDIADVFVPLPAISEYGLLVLSSVVLQMLAYHTAVALERDVDMPRNLAKSVTVE